MFTGLVDDVGVVERVERRRRGASCASRPGTPALAAGESIAVNGACLTVREHGDGLVHRRGRRHHARAHDDRRVGRPAGASTSSARCGWATGWAATSCRATSTRVGVVEARPSRATTRCWSTCALPDELEPLMVPHGSITVDGVSLTVNALPAPGILQLSLIEYTCATPRSARCAAGDRVHVEADMIGKYVRQLVAPYAAAR